MWRAAVDTKVDLLGRLAVVPIVLEAGGLDVTPGMIDIFAKANATKAVDALNVIYSEEVAHVAYGSKWFNFMCGRDNLDPKDVFHKLVRKYFKGALKAPFNEEKRADAGLPPDFYWPLADQMGVDLRLEGQNNTRRNNSRSVEKDDCQHPKWTLPNWHLGKRLGTLS